MPELSGIAPTRLLYYEDAYVKEFDTRVIKILKMENGETGVVLDETAFFPGARASGDIPSSLAENLFICLLDLGLVFSSSSSEDLAARDVRVC